VRTFLFGPFEFQLATKRGMCRFGLLDPTPLLLTLTSHVVAMGRALPAAGCGMPSLQFKIAQFLGMQRRASPDVALVLGEEMPDDHGQLPRGRDSRDVLTAAGANTEKESTQRTGRSCSCPCCFDQHASGVTTALFCDPAVMPGPGPDPGFRPE
jgi:hypothetical protein